MYEKDLVLITPKRWYVIKPNNLHLNQMDFISK